MKQQFVNWALLLALLLAFQEAVVRAIFPLPEVTNFNRVNYAAFARDGALSFPGQAPARDERLLPLELKTGRRQFR